MYACFYGVDVKRERIRDIKELSSNLHDSIMETSELAESISNNFRSFDVLKVWFVGCG